MRLIGQGLNDFISDKSKLTMSIGALTALAFGVYSARAATSVAGRSDSAHAALACRRCVLHMRAAHV